MEDNTLLLSVKDDADTREITKFDEFSITDANRIQALDYGMFYEGEFPFMLDISRKMKENAVLSDRQIAGVLNCILREAKALPTENKESVAGFVLNINPPSDTSEVVDVPETVPETKVGKVVDTNTGDTYVVEDKTGTSEASTLSDIDAIVAKMTELQKHMDEVEASDPVVLLKAAIKKSEQEEQELFKAFEQSIAVMREARKMKNIEMMQIEHGIKQAKNELNALTLDHQKALDFLAASKKMDEIEARLALLRKNAPWKDSIRDFQWEDVCTIVAAFLDGKNGVLNANDMGLGKTAESVFVLYLMKEIFPERFGHDPKILWLTKKSLMSSSIKEFRKWDPDVTPIPVTGNPAQRSFIVELALANGSPVIVNYDALNTTPLLMETAWDIVVMDEVHKLKGGSNSTPTKVWENAVAVCQKAKFIMPLSGSPIQNHPKEMWSYLYMLEPDRFPNVKDFINRFCWGYDEGLTVEWDRLIKILSNRVIRRTKAEVLKDLPDKTREFRYVEMGAAQRKIYDGLRDEFFVWLDDQKDTALTATSILAQLTRLRQVAIMPGSISVGDKSIDCDESAKLDEAMDIVEQLVGSNEQVVIFSSQFNGPLFELQTRIQKEFKVTCETITGANSSQTEYIEQRFRDGETKVLCINMKSGGEGLNLQTASHAIFLDLWWNPKANEQAEDRLHRQGQKNAVSIHILQAEDSVDSFIASILDKKDAMISGITDTGGLRGGSDWKTFLQDNL